MANENPLIALLDVVLSGFPSDAREELKAEVDRALKTKPLVTFCCDEPRQVLDPVYDEVATGEVDAQNKPIMKRTPKYGADGHVVTVPREQCNVWHFGQPNPTRPTATIFAMVLHEGIPAVIVYSFEKVQDEKGSEGTLYYRDMVFEPKTVHGPIDPTALHLDLLKSLDDGEEPDPGDEPEHTQTNGAAHA
jgi:hypothetical protein